MLLKYCHIRYCRMINNNAKGFDKLFEIVKKLRSETGCAWDRKQTPRSLLPNLVEETYELVEAVDNEDDPHVKEELGDLFLLVTMISYIKQQENSFHLDDVFDAISEKLIRRHPHVFGEHTLEDPEHIILQWNEIKRNVEGRDKTAYVTDSIPSTLPPLERSFKIQKKVSEYGFDWAHVRDVIAKLHEEIEELEAEIEKPKDNRNMKKIESELGDILFAAVNIARFLKIDPGIALHSTNTKFIGRFRYIQDKLQAAGVPLSGEQMDKMEQFWEESKEFFP